MTERITPYRIEVNYEVGAADEVEAIDQFLEWVQTAELTAITTELDSIDYGYAGSPVADQEIEQ